MANSGTTAYPASLDTFQGLTTLNKEDDVGFTHVVMHNQDQAAVTALETTVGTTAGTGVLGNFSEGDLAARVNGETFGTPAITEGTATDIVLENPTIGTPAITSGTATTLTLSGETDLDGATDNITVNGADPWRTVTLPASSWFPTTTAGCAAPVKVEAATNDIDYYALDFDTGSDENAFSNFSMPDSWDAGVVQFRYFWTNAGGGAAETVTFELSGLSLANDDPIDAAVGTPVEVADTWIAQGDMHISAWSGDVTLSGGPAAGEFVHFELMRDVSEDDLTGDARILSVQIRYKQAQFGD